MMITMKDFLVTVVCLLWLAGTGTAQTPSAPRQPQEPPRTTDKMSPTTAQATTLPPEQLITQGKALFKTAKYPQALSKFEAVLKQNADHEEALGLAAETAYRLDNQASARTWFLRRAELPNQRDTIKAYSFYRASLTLWREMHDLVAKYGTYKDGVTTYKVPEKVAVQASELGTNGLFLAERALALLPKLAEAQNVKSLLLMEAALLATEETKATAHFENARKALQRAVALLKERNQKAVEADFGYPTVLVGEFAATKPVGAATETRQPLHPLLTLQGAQVVTRVAPYIPASRAGNDVDGSTENNNRSGMRGALTAAYVPGRVKVEVLIDRAGNVVFAHVAQGRSDLNGAAVAAARKWKFTPAKLENEPVQVSGVITFELRPGSRPASSPAAAAPNKETRTP